MCWLLTPTYGHSPHLGPFPAASSSLLPTPNASSEKTIQAECAAARAQYAGGRSGRGGDEGESAALPFDAYSFASILRPANPGTVSVSPPHGLLESVVRLFGTALFAELFGERWFLVWHVMMREGATGL